MRRLMLIAAIAVAGAVLPAAAQTKTTDAQARHGVGILVRKYPTKQLPLHGGTVDSLNWSGYAVTPSAAGVTAVNSTFVVPTAGLVPPGFAATWAGVGGYSSKDLIQAGVAEDSLPSNPILGPQYYAWYELLPNSEVQLTGCSGDANCTMTPGDQIKVSIGQTGTSTWSISMTDGSKWSFSKSVSYSSTNSSAEWILEAPTLAVAQTLLANVGTVHFGRTSTYTDGSGTHTIAAGNPTEIVLSPGVVNEATPSALASDGQSFNDCAYAQSCPAP